MRLHNKGVKCVFRSDPLTQVSATEWQRLPCYSMALMQRHNTHRWLYSSYYSTDFKQLYWHDMWNVLPKNNNNLNNIFNQKCRKNLPQLRAISTNVPMTCQDITPLISSDMQGGWNEVYCMFTVFRQAVTLLFLLSSLSCIQCWQVGVDSGASDLLTYQWRTPHQHKAYLDCWEGPGHKYAGISAPKCKLLLKKYIYFVIVLFIPFYTVCPFDLHINIHTCKQLPYFTALNMCILLITALFMSFM